MIAGLSYGAWVRLTMNLTAEERAYVADLLAIAAESDRYLPLNPIALQRGARAGNATRFNRAWTRLTTGPEPVFVKDEGRGWFCPMQDAQAVENLLKTCEKPVDASTYRNREPLFARPMTVQTVQTGKTGTDRTGTGLTVPVLTGRSEGRPAPEALSPEFFFQNGVSPFPMHGLTTPQTLALEGIVAFWRARPDHQQDILHGLNPDDFREALWAALEPIIHESANPTPDEVFREAWSPAFWRTRPELTVTKTSVAPVPALFT